MASVSLIEIVRRAWRDAGGGASGGFPDAYPGHRPPGFGREAAGAYGPAARRNRRFVETLTLDEQRAGDRCDCWTRWKTTTAAPVAAAKPPGALGVGPRKHAGPPLAGTRNRRIEVIMPGERRRRRAAEQEQRRVFAADGHGDVAAGSP